MHLEPWPFHERSFEISCHDSGAIYVKNNINSGPIFSHILEPLKKWAKEEANQVFLAARGSDGGFVKMTYKEAYRSVRAIASYLLACGYKAGQNAMILSGNSIEHALFALGANLAGMTVTSVSEGYSKNLDSFDKLNAIVAKIKPDILFVDELSPYKKALDQLGSRAAIFCCKKEAKIGGPYQLYEKMISHPITSACQKAFDSLHWDMTARYMLTSGSTGSPKAVLCSHGMICHEAAFQLALEKKDIKRVYVDWHPWSHTMGLNKMFFMVLFTGGTLYIDDGRPTEKDFYKTLLNLKEISPTHYSCVPKGWQMLLNAMEKDRVLAARFFAKLSFLGYGGAPLRGDTREKLEKLALEVTGRSIFFCTGYGSTETCCVASFVFWQTKENTIGLPIPGVYMKLAPSGGGFEVRFKGPTITKGYLKAPLATKASFDDEGYFKMGDKVKLIQKDGVDEKEAILNGLLFCGRLSEQFKLSTGTWVTPGKIRERVLEQTAPCLREVAVAGEGEDYVSLLLWPSPEEGRVLEGDKKFVEKVVQGIRKYNSRYEGSSMRVRRVMLVGDGAREVNDKGVLDQRLALKNRKHLLRELYSSEPGQGVIVV